ncbi:O-antigen ligase family protein [Mycobacterium sp. B14F4]|uniref:O-antigen ligase family protein n=1 Tax=Mycobacterium sp. B14F4 TaxID=3153565 RepID=UPI00325D98B0
MGGKVQLAAILLAILALAGVVASRHSIAEAWREGRRLQAASAQGLVTGGMLTEATFVENRALLQMGVVAAFVAILLFAELSDARLRSNRAHGVRVPITRNRTPAGFILLLWAWLYAVDLWNMADEPSNQALYRAASGVALFLFLTTQRYRPIAPLQFYSAALITIAAIIVVLPFSPDGFVACGKFKCNDMGALLHGPFPSENSLGFAAAMCAVLYVMRVPFSGRTAIIMAFLIATIYATYSRTSFLALAAALGLVAVEWLVRPRSVSRSVANVAAVCCAVFPMIIGMLLVFRSEDRAFSDRGRIWALGRAAASDYPLTGRGLDSWNILARSGYFGKDFTLYPHSEYLLLYFSGGVIGLVLLALAIYRITLVAIIEQNSLASGAVVSVCFATAAMTEAVWNPLSIDAGTWIFFALISACVSLEPKAVGPTTCHSLSSPPRVNPVASRSGVCCSRRWRTPRNMGRSASEL